MSEIEAYLNSKGIEYKLYGYEARINCPWCDDREWKGAINILNGGYKCFHLNRCAKECGYNDLRIKLGDKPVPRERRPTLVKPPSKTYAKPDVVVFPTTTKIDAYFDSRSLGTESREWYGVGASNDHTIMFPYYRDGVLINVKYRDINVKKGEPGAWRAEKNAEPGLFGRDKVTGDSIILVEGEWDAMALFHYGKRNVVSVPGGANNMDWIDREWDFLSKFTEIYLCFDNDDAGQKAAAEVANRLGTYRCRIVRLPKKDANECLLARDTIAEHFESAMYIEPPLLSKPSSFLERMLVNRHAGPERYGIPTAWSKLTDMLGGWRPGEVTLWGGTNGSGKSTILSQCILDLAGKGHPSCIYSGEMLPEFYLDWAVKQHTKSGENSDFAVKHSLEWMDGKIFVLDTTDNLTPELVIENFEYAARRYGVKHFVIDSLMKMKLSGRDEWEPQKNFVNEMALFAMRLKVHVHIVAHPRKTNSDNDPLGKVDFRGSSDIVNLASNIITLTRIPEQTKQGFGKEEPQLDALMQVMKSRFGKCQDGTVGMLFNKESKLFTQI